MHNTDQIPDPASTSQALRQLLSASVHYELVHTLGAILPDPPDTTEEARYHRIQAAIAKVADLRPVNAEEAEIAANFVACSAQARETQRQARLSPEHFSRL